MAKEIKERTYNTRLKLQIIKEGRQHAWIARKIGQHPSIISDFLGRARKPNQAQMAKLAEELNCQVGDIFGEEDM